MSKPLAVVFQPLHISRMPVNFPGPLQSILDSRGFSVLSIDTIRACDEGAESVSEILNYWTERNPVITDASLVLSNALGAVVAHELSAHLARDTQIISISSPTKATETLRSIFSQVIDTTWERGAIEAWYVVERAVGASARMDPSNLLATKQANRRLIRGFGALLNYDCKRATSEAQHLAIVGAQSRLVRNEDVCKCDAPHIVEILGAEMRPHTTHLDAVSNSIQSFLDRR